MSDIEALRAAGWSVEEGAGFVLVKPFDAPMKAAPAKVMLNADGSLHLVKERSAFHRRLASVIAGQPERLLSGEVYTPRTFGQ